MWTLLAVVATAAAVLSFSALRDLALLCGFHEQLAFLLPIVIDAGAGAGCLVWLGTNSAGQARVFARSLTWTLLASSVAGNAVVHGLSAYHLAAPWWLVVAVSAIAPGVLGAVVHLAVLVGRKGSDSVGETGTSDTPDGYIQSIGTTDGPVDELRIKALEIVQSRGGQVGRGVLARELDVSEWQARRLLEELGNTNGVAR